MSVRRKTPQRSICVHGHFYQPPRENPWIEDVEIQDSAYPYHDWNQRITAECYAPNAAARILDSERKIVQIVSNYARMSFNFGPTLLSWLERQEPESYQAILDADKDSCRRFSGHGSAMAQCYNHLIMPLASRVDKQTQVVWGVRDFERRFKRQPEGMWLPETAVDLETLELLAAYGVRFTVLAPRQARAVRRIGTRAWHDVSGGHINPRQAYRCNLPSGKNISLFFYDGHTSQDIAFAGLLDSGEHFAQRLLGSFVEGEEGALVHIATDGETYGHHHPMGDMALAYCLHSIEARDDVALTNYAEYLERFPPTYEVDIFERSSWSCIHGIERWRAHCGCHSGQNPGWQQRWRAPLREAMDWLRDRVSNLYSEQAPQYFTDVVEARDDYIAVVLDRSDESLRRFFARHARKPLEEKEQVQALQFLEMQRNALLMYTSCGWFFDEISGIEPVQCLFYAARAMQLSEEVSDVVLEDSYLNILEQAPSNIPEYRTGAEVYRRFVKPHVLDLIRVGAHYAVSSLFEPQGVGEAIYCYTADAVHSERLVQKEKTLSVGRARMRSTITREDAHIHFAVMHSGAHQVFGGVAYAGDEKHWSHTARDICALFQRGKFAAVQEAIEIYFPAGQYSLEHLFKDEQRRVLYQVLDATLAEVETSLRQINDYHQPIVQVIKQLHIPLPKVLSHIVLAMINADLMQALAADETDLDRLAQLVDEVKQWSLEIDKQAVAFLLQRKVTAMMTAFAARPDKIFLLKDMCVLMRTMEPLFLQFELWKAQNIYFSVGRRFLAKERAVADQGNKRAQEWITHFSQVGEYLKVRIRERE